MQVNNINKGHKAQKIDNFNNFICEKLQAKFINRHFYLKRRKMIRLAYKRKVVHMPLLTNQLSYFSFLLRLLVILLHSTSI